MTQSFYTTLAVVRFTPSNVSERQLLELLDAGVNLSLLEFIPILSRLVKSALSCICQIHGGSVLWNMFIQGDDYDLVVSQCA